MKKTSIVILSVFLLSLFSVSIALSEESTTDRTRVLAEKTAMMEKRMVELSERPNKPMIHKLHVMGKGLAVNPSDLNDFQTAALVAGNVVIQNGSILSRGSLQIGKDKYKLMEIKVENGVASAKVYGRDSNSQVGDISLQRKDDSAIWHGLLNINSKQWHVYMLGLPRRFSAEEIAEKTRNYCKDNPDDQACNSVAGYICRSDPEECREKVMRFCQTHADDSRCKDILEKFCRSNPDDERCDAPESTTTTVAPETTQTTSVEATTTVGA